MSKPTDREPQHRPDDFDSASEKIHDVDGLTFYHPWRTARTEEGSD